MYKEHIIYAHITYKGYIAFHYVMDYSYVVSALFWDIYILYIS